MTRELFIETIEALEKQYDYDKSCAKAFQHLLPEDRITIGYNNSFIQSQIIKLLVAAMSDTDCWIEYYLYEINFGKEYIEGCVTDNGKNIDLSDAGKLWDYLNEINKTK